jgi:hypothetical protein
MGLVLDVLDKMNMKETRLIFEAEAGIGVGVRDKIHWRFRTCLFLRWR